MFQKTVINKYLSRQPREPVHEKYLLLQNYFGNHEIREHLQSIKEEEFQDGFLRKVFVELLGYTLKPDPHFNLLREKKNENDQGKADGAILHDQTVIGVIELKDMHTTDLSKVENQAFGYKNRHRGAKYVITSNFRKIRFYIDNAVEHLEFDLFELSLEQYELFHLCLSWDSIKNGIPVKMRNESNESEEAITKQFYRDYSSFKTALFNDLCENNKGFDKLVLFRKTQKLLDRLLFIFFAEDKGLLNPNEIKKIIQDWETLRKLDAYDTLYNRFQKYFGYLNTGNEALGVFPYNGGLFQCDAELDSLKITDSILHEHSLQLSNYDFNSDVDVNILGHIFEHSLAEMEEIASESHHEEKKRSPKRNHSVKRKRDGIFYTPKYITKFITQNTLERICESKKRELQLRDDLFVAKKRNKKERERLHSLLDAYSDWLLTLRICDPACGSGAFLNQAFEFLVTEHRTVDEFHTNIEYGNISQRVCLVFTFSDIETKILENNLYGVDINEESVEIAKLSLWLRSAEKGRKLNDLSNRIKQGDSLVSDPQKTDAVAFDWEKEFPEVFLNGGFDCIIGNPPYVRKSKSSPLASLYQWNTDLYLMFFERVFRKPLLKNGGMFGFIVPRFCLVNRETQEFRRFFLQNVETLELVETSPFEDAETENVIWIVQNSPAKHDRISILRDEHEFFLAYNDVSKKHCLENRYAEILTFQKPKEIKHFKAMQRNTVPLEKIAVSRRGMEIGKKNLHEGTIPCLIGEDLVPYSIEYRGTYVAEDHPEYLRLKSFFAETTLYLRRVASSLIATVSKDNYAFNKNIYGFSFDEAYDPCYILTLINSSLFTNYYLSRFSTKKIEVFPEIQTYLYNQLPIKTISLEEQKDFVHIGKSLLETAKMRQENRGRFFKRLRDNFGDGFKLSKFIRGFPLYDFPAFLNEMKRQNITLDLRIQEQWDSYFHELRSQAQILHEEIKKKNQLINLMVDKLYINT